MANTLGRRRRQQYSKLICLGCRSRRIRCVLPDSDIQPSITPQPAHRACQRCRQHGLDCVVDYTTLGRPSQKPGRVGGGNAELQRLESSMSATSSQEALQGVESQDVDGFLLSHPQTDGYEDDATASRNRPERPSRTELCESMISAYHLLSALLSRDKHFASSIGALPMIHSTVVDLVDEIVFALLDTQLVWHKLYHPDIPSLSQLRDEVKSLEPGQSQHTSAVFLLTLLCDLALEVPCSRLGRLTHLQSTTRALVYHWGQKLLFSLPRNPYTILSLILTAQYRPFALTGSQFASPHTLKAIPHVIMAKYVAAELGYSKAGCRLAQALTDASAATTDIEKMMYQCFHWIRLNVSEDAQTGMFDNWPRRMDPTALECLDALRTAFLLNRMPTKALVPYTIISCATQLLANVRDLTEHWKELSHVEEVVHGHKLFCEREKQIMDQILDLQDPPGDLRAVVTHLVATELHFSHVCVVGAALFYAVMSAAHAQSHEGAIRAEQAIGVSDDIILQLMSTTEDDPCRPDPRKFLEEYGTTRTDELEHILTNFITAADTLRLDDVPYIARTRETVATMVYMCKDIVESNAARLKGWAGLHERVDVQMILFLECARRLEAMSAKGGTEEALNKGCLLTAGAKLIRSLHRILQGFKKTVARASSRCSASDRATVPPPGFEKTTPTGQQESVLNGLSEYDIFADWDNWPQFESLDLSKMLGGASVLEYNDAC